MGGEVQARVGSQGLEPQAERTNRASGDHSPHIRSDLAGLPNFGARVQPLLQLQHALNASPRMQMHHALQRVLHRGLGWTAEAGGVSAPLQTMPVSPQTPVIQKRPVQVGQTGQWRDELFPSLRLSHPNGYARDQFRVDDGTDVWWDESRYYTDADFENLYRPYAELPPDQEHFIVLEPEESDIGTEILDLADVMSRLDAHSRGLMTKPEKWKVDLLVADIMAGGAIYPIELDLNSDDSYALIQGRHRLIASQQLGLKKIPALVRGRPEEDSIRDDPFFVQEDESDASDLAEEMPLAGDAEISKREGFHIFGKGYQVHNERWIEEAFEDVKSNPTELSALADMMVVEFGHVDQKMKIIYLSYLSDIQEKLSTQPMFEEEAEKLGEFLGEFA